jgi:hypothetical protein
MRARMYEEVIAPTRPDYDEGDTQASYYGDEAG